MDQRPTSELSAILSKAGVESIDSFIKENQKYMVHNKKEFYYYMKDMYAEKGILHSYVYSFVGITEKRGGQILRMERHTPNRDTIILGSSGVMVGEKCHHPQHLC